MLDFFRDVVLDISGIDSEKIKENRVNKRAEKKKHILSGSTKGVIYFLGILYLFMGGLSVWYTRGNENIFAKLKFFLLTIIDIAALIFISADKKKTEIIGLILFAIFVIIMYTTTMFLN